jgi:thioredoxin 1
MFTELTDKTYKDSIASTQAGVLICFKRLCPHCKNMEKVIEKFFKKNSDLALFSLNGEENPVAVKELDALRQPTTFAIKEGKVVSKKAGLMNPKEMAVFYKDG